MRVFQCQHSSAKNHTNTAIDWLEYLGENISWEYAGVLPGNMPNETWLTGNQRQKSHVS